MPWIKKKNKSPRLFKTRRTSCLIWAALITSKILVRVLSGELPRSQGMDPLIPTPSRESSISLMAVKSAHLRAARGPLLCW